MRHEIAVSQWQWESVAREYDLSPYLPAGVTVSSAAATLTNPDGGTASLANNPTIDATDLIVSALVTAAELTRAGVWKLDIVATLDGSSEAPGVRFKIKVED